MTKKQLYVEPAIDVQCALPVGCLSASTFSPNIEEDDEIVMG